jgi:hypothetical protein
MDEKKRQNKQYQREVCCPIHNKLLGKYDARVGVINVTYFCPLCRREYTFTIKRDPKTDEK